MIEATHILVSGIVQGVGYRYWTRRTALELSLSGWVRNLHDGRVEIHAEGSAEAVGELIERCKKGPRSAVVEAVMTRACRLEEASGFNTQRDAEAPEA